MEQYMKKLKKRGAEKATKKWPQRVYEKDEWINPGGFGKNRFPSNDA
jgi:hypothetical protein